MSSRWVVPRAVCGSKLFTVVILSGVQFLGFDVYCPSVNRNDPVEKRNRDELPR
jgi:hypothetical protein